MKTLSFFDKEEWQELKKIEKLELKEKEIVFYVENIASMNHFRLLIKELIENYDYRICIVSSIKKIHFNETEKIKIFFIGNGSARTKFFLTLKAKILIMDMPDLENFHIKKSKIYPVHYIYIFHSMFSTHSYLREKALFHYNTIFCVGEHHIKEIRNTEKIYNLKPKELLNYGFSRLDELIDNNNEKSIMANKHSVILIAPSYGKNNIIEKCGLELIEFLINNNYQVVLRPHHKSFEESKKKISQIEKKFSNDKNFRIEKGVISNELLQSSLCLISDWSGISFEYAFIQKKPTIFINLPKKENNSNVKKIGIEPIEIKLREEIGYIIQPFEFKKIIESINDHNINKKKEFIEHHKSKLIFNIGNSAKIGGKYIDELLKKLI